MSVILGKILCVILFDAQKKNACALGEGPPPEAQIIEDCLHSFS